MSFFSRLNQAKDFTLEWAIKLWFNNTYNRYGYMTTIQIDSAAKFIRVELELKGEALPIKIDVTRYQISTKCGETFIVLGDIETSREWINQLINDYLPIEKKSFKVPSVIKVFL